MKLDPAKVVRDPRGVIDLVEEIVNELGEKRVKQIDPKLNIFAHASDIIEWDRVLLERYLPLYTGVEKGTDDVTQARLSLQAALKGLAPTLSTTRELLDFTRREFGDEKEISFGRSIEYKTPNTSMITGLVPTSLSEVEEALSYAEAQFAELTASAYYGQGTVMEFEEKVLHAGSILFLAMELAELIKTAYYGFINAGEKELKEMPGYPEVKTPVGLGTVDLNKKVILFTGSDFLPAWCAVNYMKEKGLEDEIEICGTGSAAHDIVRFYENGKILASSVKTIEVVKTGIADVIVVTHSSYEQNILEEAKKVGSKVISVGYRQSLGLDDRTEDSVDEIVKDILDGAPGVWIADHKKAGEVAVEVAKKLERDYSIPEEKKKEFEKDRFFIRAGRGPISHLEIRDMTFGLVLGGNGPGMIGILGDGDYPGPESDVAEMVKELLARNCLIMAAGDAAADAGRYFDEKEQKFQYEQYLSVANLKGLINCGGFTAICQIPAALYKGCLLSTGSTPRANFTQIADWSFNRLPFVIIIWGAATEEMYTVAAGFVRGGIPVILGPSGFRFKRYLMGNKHDRSKWWIYDGITGEKKEIEPGPVHMIIPVETKEEAITMAMKLCMRPLALRDPRLSSLENYNDTHKKYFGDYSDDWHLYVRSEQEIHAMRRMEMLRILEKKHGWEIDRTRVVKVRHRDGRIIPMEEYVDTYGVQQGRYSTLAPRLVVRM
ncbi:MAG: anaerobic carbon-monoxide dehydrogenase catalytic subunit [Candidatus Syntropharchaeia archaeon]